MFRSSGAIVLPGPLQRRADELARSFLQPEQGIDFSAPPGEPALVAADSVSWRIFKNPVTVFIGGVAAVLMEFAEPRVRDGVWQHSNFRADPLTRLRRTGLAAMVTVYGPQGAAQAMIAGVARRHERVSGRTLEGEPYRASDPDLLDWVQATAGFGFTQAYHAYARPLTAQERGLLLIEALPAARLYGATGAPASGAELDALFEARRPRLAASPVIFAFLEIMGQAPILPAPVRPLQRLLVRAAADILPPWLRERLGLGSGWSLTGLERGFARAAAQAGDRLILRSSPWVLSCRRLGLPDAYLYRHG
ncbi:MAG TPA: oxygenase MpaB family protein [Microvirga sp.]|nr:oxygenase MpaB family protein [Microvirga sp.]